MSSRVETPRGLWVYWACEGQKDFSRVQDIGVGGLFIETPKPRRVGGATKLQFIVEEGKIRAEAVIQHVKPGRGLGLKITAVRDEDRRQFGKLLARVRAWSGKFEESR
ncbi:MAG TPA: PilZ domain-containing protein [Candidatus Dormibacteraeota bacterium]|nr:PilZ domain-containing protein [Candidatus Dormibacteraeota bacterium]